MKRGIDCARQLAYHRCTSALMKVRFVISYILARALSGISSALEAAPFTSVTEHSLMIPVTVVEGGVMTESLSMIDYVMTNTLTSELVSLSCIDIEGQLDGARALSIELS